jgi:dienelactone hydrolase
MRPTAISSLAGLVLAGALAAQHPVGTFDVSWPNASGQGSATLDARLHYPADSAGFGSRIAQPPTAEGWPVVVFLHGYGLIGNDYAHIGDSLAEAGYVAVMLNTAQWSYQQMEYDTRALHDAIEVVANDPFSKFFNRIDESRVGLLGHSMGGAVIAYVLHYDLLQPLSNPGYKCGLAVAPVDPALAVAGVQVRVPIGIVSGQGDQLTPPAVHASPYYQSVTPLEGLKFHYAMGHNCDHLNIVGLSQNIPIIWDRTETIMHGFFGQFLNCSITGLEGIIGDDGKSDPNLVEVLVDTSIPQAWADSEMQVGKSTRISVALEGGYGGLLGADAMSTPLATALGPLRVNPASAFTMAQLPMTTERLDVTVNVPNLPALVGMKFAVQGGGTTVFSQFYLGSALLFEIGL